MTVVTTTSEVGALTAPEYWAALDELDAGTHPERGIDAHLTTPIVSGAVTSLHDVFGPRPVETPVLVGTLPRRPRSGAAQ